MEEYVGEVVPENVACRDYMDVITRSTFCALRGTSLCGDYASRLLDRGEPGDDLHSAQASCAITKHVLYVLYLSAGWLLC